MASRHTLIVNDHAQSVTASRSDSAILAELLALHAVDGPVLDASWGSGGIWSRALLERYRPTRVDARPETHPDVVGDRNRLDELFPSSAFTTAIWDPPHISDAGGGLVGDASWAGRYGTRSAGLRGESICHLFELFLRSVREVLDLCRGTLLVKLADQVHQGELQFQPFWLWRTAVDLGWFACDEIVRKRAQPIHNTTKVQRHIRRGDGAIRSRAAIDADSGYTESSHLDSRIGQ
jgi:hypothetical protein